MLLSQTDDRRPGPVSRITAPPPFFFPLVFVCPRPPSFSLSQLLLPFTKRETYIQRKQLTAVHRTYNVQFNGAGDSGLVVALRRKTITGSYFSPSQIRVRTIVKLQTALGGR